MSEESATRDLVVLTQRVVDAISARDFDAVTRYYAPNAVFESGGIGVFEGHAAIRAFLEEWIGAFDGHEVATGAVRDVGGGVTCDVLVQRARVPGGEGMLEVQVPGITIWADGLIERSVVYTDTDIDEARAAAERLAEERG
jgi:ketosteroid isomerase-like protein